MFAYVQGGAVVSTQGQLPSIIDTGSGTITGFDLADPATQAANGWLPLVLDQPTPGPNQTLDGPTYEIQATQVIAHYTVRDLTADEIAAALEVAKTLTLGQLQALFASKLAAGYPAGNGLFVAIDDGSRANLGGMALTAALVAQSAPGVSWPASYSQGWIALGGTRIPLPNPSDGTALAFGAGVYYSQLAQNEQTLSDDIAACADAASLAVVDITQGWPG